MRGISKRCERPKADMPYIIPKFIEDRYSDWDNELGKLIHNKETSLETIHQNVLDKNIEPETRSGRQEYLENIINKYL